ncbi:MAG: excinuclease ABC subunit UvrB [Parcubacteria group bacterium]|nr:excinuclease ABC subunit UvrB [Parcubacteria group bacterium]
MFKLVTKLRPMGDQPDAISRLTTNLNAGLKDQVLLGVTGSGKTFTLANVIQKVQRPTLVISHNKVLAAQLYQEFKEFFPENAVHYFVSYYDYYQPEAYLPSSDTYIEKDAKINDLLDQLRHAATADILSRKDVIVVASVSCIYGIGDPAEYENVSLDLAVGQPMKRNELLRHLTELQYKRNDIDPVRGEFRARGDQVEIWLPHGTEKIELVFGGNAIVSLYRQPLLFKLRDPRSLRYTLEKITIFPAKHFVTQKPKLELALKNIEAELTMRLQELKKAGKLLEAERLEQRTNFDLEMLLETGYSPGIENYSRHLSFRKPGEPSFTLLDYFRYAIRRNGSREFLTVIDESHMSVPQIRGMHNGDRARKQVLVDYGFRLPSALDNRPLKFEEFEKKIGQAIYVSATPGLYELEKASKLSKQVSSGAVIEQLIRPTGILDPEVEVRPIANQVTDLLKEIEKRVAKKERTLIVTLTKRLAEDLAEYLAKKKVRVHWIHSEVKTLVRPELLKDLREGKVDVMVGVNLLREGLDLPEVSLVAILDADKEGFLRNETTLIQTMGRAARHIHGKVILYADRITGSMERAMKEVERRREIQAAWNKKHAVTPKSIVKPIRPSLVGEPERIEKLVLQFEETEVKKLSAKPRVKNQLREALEREMWHAAKDWDFERAAKIRDHIERLR